MDILAEENYTIITRHFVYLLYLVAKFIFLIIIAGVIYAFVLLNKGSLNDDIIVYVFFPIVFLLVNY